MDGVGVGEPEGVTSFGVGVDSSRTTGNSHAALPNNRRAARMLANSLRMLLSFGSCHRSRFGLGFGFGREATPSTARLHDEVNLLLDPARHTARMLGRHERAKEQYHGGDIYPRKEADERTYGA